MHAVYVFRELHAAIAIVVDVVTANPVGWLAAASEFMLASRCYAT